MFRVDLVIYSLDARPLVTLWGDEIVVERTAGLLGELQFLGFGKEVVGGYREFGTFGSLRQRFSVGVARTCHIFVDSSAHDIFLFRVGEGEFAEFFPADGRFELGGWR